ncbi:UDP-N-acetylmuramoyl-L-alanyl-D-glutamate--2,6-diaminopimelate ligase [Romboutsia lituseburensis]|uniref:UDP-N-acetylmuramoyl-L-alanyl-D-glutamate--2, 6-diaminopimelate ligase n=1 Tax=Romboutsia lituseburensis TaxID=1537 RepID=UPI00215B6F02|nr:UDP-N-acetylmuramoyl-L-alanyl-D-glutamate--2,6-diaminopimelate ligase [Romboutsia lituseburensis]MCR8744735.1 UDP-N-acetylmuramoyl-L-alanyl-D-glutamate--2,6-diaminopimelate ligase [Romboutsia lituseburensis]
MKLYKLIENLNIMSIDGNMDIDISDIHYDSRLVTQNSLFICIKGFNSDGHKYINSAIEKGAKAFLIQDDIDIKDKENYTFIKVKDTREGMSTIACNFYKNPANTLEVIGVTGTNGKTSITTFLKQILSKRAQTGLIGTININDGKNEIISKNTTPESIDLQSYFNDMINNNCKYCAMEVSSHSLALNRVGSVNFSIGIFTNLTEDHLDFHKNLEDYRNAKEKLFHKTSIANIINIDDEGGKVIFNNIKKLNTPIYTYGINSDADFTASEIKLYPNGVSYKLKTPTYTDYIYVNIPGKFTVYNTLGVISACYILNIDIETIKEVLKNTPGVKGRFENIKNDEGLTVIVDYAHTPDALENVLKTSKEFVKGKIITVVGCGGDRDKIKRPIMGKIAQENSDISIITSDNPRTECPSIIIKDILKGIDTNNDNFIVIEDRKKAIYKAIELANVGDVVMISGKGHENYQIVGTTKHHFDDKEIALEAIDVLKSSAYNI